MERRKDIPRSEGVSGSTSSASDERGGWQTADAVTGIECTGFRAGDERPLSGTAFDELQRIQNESMNGP